MVGADSREIETTKMNPPLLLLLLGIAIGFVGLLAHWLKAERASHVILRMAQIPLFLWIGWWAVAWIAAFLRGRNGP